MVDAGLLTEPFDPATHDASRFSCGVEMMDEWLRAHAAEAARRRTANTFVWVLDGSVVGYYALSAHRVSRAEVPAAIGRGGPIEIPAVLLGKLALDSSVRGRGFGEVLVADALKRVLVATRIVAAKLVVVDALSEPVAAFYERLGFRRIPGGSRLVQRVRDIEAALG